MRLSKIKLAGFKSFVDPTSIQFPSDRVGVVGPNGCGKSNIIDAVRWVMGESSRQIRGDSMEDVIFNGSNSRKPVGLASIELVFDNADGRVGGQYANYNEISIRRQVSRDGQSKYFLNGGKCRRRDVTDIFLGTGLGPRSYAIIEQGMISRLIEAKPEELRVYLEEAAGISKYKERRRETENRIGHTRENMSRLNDLREEVDKQLNHLQRQAKTAQRYKVLKQEQRRVKAELLALRWQALDAECTQREQTLKAHELRVERVVAELRAAEAAIEKQRLQHSEANESFNTVQGRYYQLGGDISRAEQAIQHAKETRAQQRKDYEETCESIKRAEEEMGREHEHIERLKTEIEALEPQLHAARTEQGESTGKLGELEQAQAGWQNQWDELTRRLAEPTQMAQVERARLEHLEGQLAQLAQREARLSEEQAGLADDELQGQVESFETRLYEVKSDAEQHEQHLREILSAIDSRREHNRQLNRHLDEARGEAQRVRGRLASLEALQEAALGKRQKEVVQWLERQQLATASRLGEQVTVDPGWEKALESVLGQYLEAVCVEDLDAVSAALDTLAHGHLLLLDVRSAGGEALTHARTMLLEKVRGPDSLTALLDGIYTAQDLNEALAMHLGLGPRESVISKDGVWVGKHWLRVARDPDEHAGVLARETEIRMLAAELADTQASIERLERELQAGRETLKRLEQAREQTQAQSNSTHHTLAEVESRLHQYRSELEHVRARKAQLAEELAEIRTQIEHNKEQLMRASRRRDQALEAINRLNSESEALQSERDVLRQTLEETRSQAQQRTEDAYRIALRIESLRTARASAEQGLTRMHAQLVHGRQRLGALRAALEDSLAPLQAQEQELEALLNERVKIEQSLAEARSRVQAAESEIRDQDERRLTLERQIESLREEHNGLQMAWQETNVRRQTLREQVDESGFALQQLLKEMDEGASVQGGEERVESLDRRIARLGPINLAAIDEFKEQSQRKEYLDSQHADLTEALETLENAIRKIDRETRHRFKETFERVNSRLEQTFPRLFGGGQGYLEMTGDDLLTTGVAVLARPPGKRISSIHLLSGGEKALAAVALVFAIFELNPSPFCMLDEVDAPLDDANIGRFCELVRELSQGVQFIFITHNKITMELADQLVGVTMHEPGVSRLVAVDVEEAARMAVG